MDSFIPQIALFGILLGLVSHLGFFIRGEHHLRAFEYFIAALSFPFLGFLSLVYNQVPAAKALLITSIFCSAFLCGLFGSIFIYRVFFHQLRSFSGPFPAKVTKLWHVSKIIAKFDNYKHLDRLHRQYGEYVRTGRTKSKIYRHVFT